MIDEVLNERQTVYGDFNTLAHAVQAYKSTARSAPSWLVMTSTQREAVDMITLKLCRVLYGDPLHMDSWLDIAGYATLATEEFTSKRPMAPAPNPVNPIELMDTIKPDHFAAVDRAVHALNGAQ